MLLQSVFPWMSETDIEKGSRSLDELSRALAHIKVGIVCLTPENLLAPWLLYEAGALSKTIDDKTHLYTYLIGPLEFQDVEPPLGMFQHTKSEKEETRKLVHSINKAISDDPLPEARLNELFEVLWPKFEEKLLAAPKPERIVEAKRNTDQMVTEILEFTRSETNRRKKGDLLEPYIPMILEVMPLFADVAKAAKAQTERGNMSSKRQKVQFSGTLRGQEREASCVLTATKVTLAGTNEFSLIDYTVVSFSEILPDGEYELSAEGSTYKVHLRNGVLMAA
jgi:hypothetical protein